MFENKNEECAWYKYDPVVSNTRTSAARILNSLHLEKQCVASGKMELNAKQYSKSYTH